MLQIVSGDMVGRRRYSASTNWVFRCQAPRPVLICRKLFLKLFWTRALRMPIVHQRDPGLGRIVQHENHGASDLGSDARRRSAR